MVRINMGKTVKKEKVKGMDDLEQRDEEEEDNYIVEDDMIDDTDE